ncbi:hypothetical protein OROGR_025265 [Orobanche gracilis]
MDLRKPIRHQTDVALNIAKHLFSKDEYQEKNFVFSPFSLHSLLSLMAAGSQGSTRVELLSFLGSHSSDHLNTFYSQLVSAVLSDAAPSLRLSYVNGVWADKSVPLSHSFKQLVATHYKATLTSVDFTKVDQVCHEVNSWVERETHGLISGFCPSNAITKLTSLVYANALCFKGAWKHKFDPLSTFHRDFHLLNGTSVNVPFMSSKKETQFISVFDDFKVLRLSYKQGRDKKRQFSMYIFLPDAKDGLPALIEKLASESSSLKDKLPRQKVRVLNFGIPKFNISSTFEASNVLKELGVVSPFSRDADFTKMLDSPSIEEVYVGSMFHKASIEVNEEGTEATAINILFMKNICRTRCPGIDFVADHPFLFLIREDLTGTILFMGQVLHPDGADSSAKAKSAMDDFLRAYHARRAAIFKDVKKSRDFNSEADGEKEGEIDDSYISEMGDFVKEYLARPFGYVEEDNDDKHVVLPKRKRSNKNGKEDNERPSK